MLAPMHGGGFRALQYTLRKGRQVGFLRLWKAMRTRNACKTCALGMGGQMGGMVNEAGRFPEVCKKSLQAMVADMQGRIERKFFEAYTLEELAGFSSRELEAAGRLAEPVIARAGSSRFEPIGWDEALECIAEQMAATDPRRAFFYASGRSSNEAGFLLQLLARCYGTNHLSNCSYYCHQASGVGLFESIGTGTATVTLEDIEACDLLFLIGGNPASNHPRLMTSLVELRRRGGKVVVVNPIREPGLVEFRVPSRLASLLFGSSIASEYVQPKIGGDIAFLVGLAKALFDAGSVDDTFVAASTEGIADMRAVVDAAEWPEIERSSGVERAQIERVAEIYAKSERAIFAWTMGITHHEHGVENVQWIANLALLRGMVGKPGAGLMPIRGHSNVQGLGSMGVYPGVRAAALAKLNELGVRVPEWRGHDTMAAMEAASRGEMDFALCLGGNLFGANPDADFAAKALGSVSTVVYLSTSLNTGHVRGRGETTLILPVCARDEEDQTTTQESMFSFVRVSDGGPRRHPGARTEVEILAEVGRLLSPPPSPLPETRAIRGEGEPGTLSPEQPAIDWARLRDHDTIREFIASLVPEYEQIVRKEEFHVPGRALHGGTFPTKSGRASFHASPIPFFEELAPRQLRLMTIRSEGQFNTVVYEEEDLYRGQDRRDVILLHVRDMATLGIAADQPVRVSSEAGEMVVIARPFEIAEGCAAMYYPEANVLVPKGVDPRSRTPAFKSVVVTVAPYDGLLVRRDSLSTTRRGDLKAC